MGVIYLSNTTMSRNKIEIKTIEKRNDNRIYNCLTHCYSMRSHSNFTSLILNNNIDEKYLTKQNS